MAQVTPYPLHLRRSWPRTSEAAAVAELAEAQGPPRRESLVKQLGASVAHHDPDHQERSDMTTETTVDLEQVTDFAGQCGRLMQVEMHAVEFVPGARP